MQVKIVSIGLIHKGGGGGQMKQYIFRHHTTSSGTIHNHKHRHVKRA